MCQTTAAVQPTAAGMKAFGRKTPSPTSSPSSKKHVDYTFPPAPATPSKISDHMSGILMTGDVTNTLLEVLFISVFFFVPPHLVPGSSMSPFQVGMFALAKSVFTRLYNAFQEAVFFAFPKGRTQPLAEHKLAKSGNDLNGRDKKQQDTLVAHDRLTLITDSVLNIILYLSVDGFYPGTAAVPQTFAERAARLVLNHYLMSFGMYWAHRALHVVPYLWRHIHSIHHYASTPLSRVTYQDHWFDNFGNAVVGQTFAQILIPLDLPTFVFSRLFRVAESLEKHSGHSSNWNLAHAIQFAWMPFAQMPHHHDWHHEGFKSCNYTFSSMGGVWDWVFGTRRAGRAANEGEPAGDWATKEDKVLNAMGRQPIVKSFMDTPICVVLPDVALGVAAAYKLWLCGGTVCAA